jgi:hypothetical protein
MVSRVEDALDDGEAPRRRVTCRFVRPDPPIGIGERCSHLRLPGGGRLDRQPAFDQTLVDVDGQPRASGERCDRLTRPQMRARYDTVYAAAYEVRREASACTRTSFRAQVFAPHRR